VRRWVEMFSTKQGCFVNNGKQNWFSGILGCNCIRQFEQRFKRVDGDLVKILQNYMANPQYGKKKHTKQLHH
jgi:hypothetical protein